jgi:hypothetical protein
MNQTKPRHHSEICQSLSFKVWREYLASLGMRSLENCLEIILISNNETCMLCVLVTDYLCLYKVNISNRIAFRYISLELLDK